MCAYLLPLLSAANSQQIPTAISVSLYQQRFVSLVLQVV
jgi:hypothetical protein